MQRSKFKLLMLPAFALALLCAALIYSISPTSAQDSPRTPLVAHNPIVHQATHFDISPAFRDLAREAGEPEKGFQEADSVRRPKEQLLRKIAGQGLRPVQDRAFQNTILSEISATIGLNFLGVGVGF